MRTTPLLCELHAHTTWSDGDLSMGELVDLYGAAGFDVLAVTDHIVRPDDPYLATGENRSVTAESFPRYLAEIESEAERARRRHGLLVIPGAELTFEDPDPARAAHAVALGLRSFVGLEDGLDAALAAARARGAVLIGAHPYEVEAARRSARGTARFAAEPEWAASVVDRFELCNRHDFFPWVAESRLPAVATGDFHRPEHLATWKTLAPAEKTEVAVLDFLRSRKTGRADAVRVLCCRVEPQGGMTLIPGLQMADTVPIALLGRIAPYRMKIALSLAGTAALAILVLTPQLLGSRLGPALDGLRVLRPAGSGPPVSASFSR